MLDVLLLVAFAAGAVYLGMHLLYRKKEKALLDAENDAARVRGLTELSADWFWETDAEHRVRWLSGGAPVATFFGGMPTYGKTFWEIPGVELEERALQAHLERLDARQPTFDLELARCDERGARQVHIVSGQVRIDADGNFLGYRGVGRDITEQRAAERALWHAKERLELALDGGNLAEFHFDTERRELSAGDGWVRFLGLVAASGEYVWETDAEWRYTSLSARAEAVLGYARAELLGRKPREFMPLGEPKAVETWFAGRAAEGKPFRDLLHRMITKSGGVLWLSISGVPVRDAAGNLIGWRGTGADVTAR